MNTETAPTSAPVDRLVGPFSVGGYELRVTRLTVVPPNEPLFSERATDVEIVNEAAGEFVSITQKSMRTDAEPQRVYFDASDWPAVRQAVDVLVSLCRDE